MRIRCVPTPSAPSHASASPASAANARVLVVGAFHNGALSLAGLGLGRALEDALGKLAKEDGFVGRTKQQVVLRPLSGRHEGFKAIVLLGLGKGREMKANGWLRAAGTAARAARALGASEMVVALPGLADAADAPAAVLPTAMVVAQGLRLGLYRFTACRSPLGAEDGQRERMPTEVALWVGGGHHDDAGEAAQVGLTVADAVVRARDWVNLPANRLGPAELMQAAKDEAKALGLKFRVLEEAALKKEGMGLLLGVGQGSERPPRLVHLSYQGAPAKEAESVALIGKGILFDSGGLCIKPCESMSTMKMDMGGAAAVLATIGAAARLELPVNVHAILALAENMPSGHAIRPGDILTSAAGKTVEVNNTDAEGRLVLADAIHYAKALAPAAMVDVATLTGACIVALGPTTAGLYCNDEAFAGTMQEAALDAGEDVWRMPLTKSLRDQLKSDCADMRNTGERYGGSITAALFLQEFVGDVPWAHLDIAGPAWGSEEGAHMSKGGTGAATATLVRWLMHRALGQEGEPAAPRRRRRRGRGR